MASRRMCSVLRIVVCLVIAVFILTPVVLLVASSLKPSDQIMNLGLFNSPLSIESYIAVLKEDTFFRYMKNSFIVAGTVTFSALLFHAMAGYALARLNFIGKNAVFSWILSTMMVPFSVLMIPLFVIVKVFGLLNTLGSVILPSIPHAYGIFLFRQFFLGIPSDIEEAATIDGASYIGIFYRIFLPLSKSIMIALGASFFIRNWNRYLWPLVVLREKRLWLIQVAIAAYQHEYSMDWSRVLTACVIAIAPIVVLFFTFQKYLVEGVKMSGIK